jgi:hypothetical protein
MRRAQPRIRPKVQNCCNAIRVSTLNSHEFIVSCQLAPGVCRAQLVQTEHPHHGDFLISKVSRHNEERVG